MGEKNMSWQVAKPDFNEDEVSYLSKLEQDMRVQLAPLPKRITHVLGVADTCAYMANIFGVDAFLAYAAGLLHDWYKVANKEELLQAVQKNHIALDLPAEDVLPILHGMIAARELPWRYPELPATVWQAIDRHTTADFAMSELDMIVFVADMIEPHRKDVESITRLRQMVDGGSCSLIELFSNALASSIQYVLETQRVVYPRSIAVYNEYARMRERMSS